jgi:hypothetical protein
MPSVAALTMFDEASCRQRGRRPLELAVLQAADQLAEVRGQELHGAKKARRTGP